MTKVKGSYPCKEGCECKRHSVGERRDSQAAALKGWSNDRQAACRAQQNATSRSFDGFFVEELKGYHRAHGAIEASRGKAKTYLCACNAQAFCWAFAHRTISDMADVKRDPKLGFYSINVFDYEPMCGSCHRRYDNI